MKPIGFGGWSSNTHRPHSEEAQSRRPHAEERFNAIQTLRRVSKHGRWLGLACGRPSRRAQARFGRFLYGRNCKGSRMRATMKFAVICVSLLIAAHADAVGRRNQTNALDFRE